VPVANLRDAPAIDADALAAALRLLPTSKRKADNDR
jgi:hypothetical protein